ncbi:hypothetical protein GGU10DRAFT_382553 [Lentinula aff. detonsa]|uniref:Uncharacterized protein n=1 Tax=Lentinula aff. detonsa TaxID=2804958 RepID=A0AA38KCM7_9AGAR|nr:hypothetical protein GGU10DRAFT_382553 [Lentinula aff. detonsa]
MTALPQLSAAFRKLNNDMADEIEFNAHGKIGSCSSARAQKFRNSDFPSPGDLKLFEAFITPPISSIVPKYTPRLPNVQGIAAFCQKQFGWQPELAFKKLHANLWPAVIIQMLCSDSVAYNPNNSEILAPQVEPVEDNLQIDSKGKSFIPTYSTTILNQKPLDLQAKNIQNAISITFCTNIFIQLSGLSNVSLTTRRRFNVPGIIIAYAMNNVHLKHSLSEPYNLSSPEFIVDCLLKQVPAFSPKHQ